LRFSGSRRLSTRLRSDERTDRTRGSQTDACCILVRRSGARRLRDPPLDSVLEEQARTSQPDPSRNPRPHSGLLGQALRKETDLIALPTYAGLGGRCSYRGHLCGPIWTARTRTKIASTSNAQSPSLSTYHCTQTTASPPDHPFFEIIPHAIGRLRSLIHRCNAENLQDITAHLSRPAPLLEKLSICGDPNTTSQHYNPVLTPALFNGDLSSLRKLKPGVRSHRVTLEKHGQSHLVQAVLHVAGRSYRQSAS
jgi:hypothetical protein